MNALTEQQRCAIEADGNVLVVAGAGTGKTHTLVERCLARVCAAENPVSLENILMVTFTEAAAAEMRQRLRGELERRSAALPDNIRLAEQLALVETAKISTLHSFCLQLVREHFHELDLDPQVTVLAEEQARLLARESLDSLLQRHYEGGTPVADAVQQLVLDHGRGGDLPIRRLTLRLHHYTQTLRDPEAWFEEQLARLEQSSPTLWRLWLGEGFEEWRANWLPLLRAQPKENINAHRCADALAGKTPMADALAQIVELDDDNHWPRGTKGKYRDPIAGIFDDAAFLRDLTATTDNKDPLAEDWSWVRPQMMTLLHLARAFTGEFSRAKRELAVVDFHDLEQFALRLLLDPRSGVTQHWRERLRLVFVDEYQDINAAQDAILCALGGEEKAANRFLVGDVKQSIYRFRLADPTIFQRYKTDWEKRNGEGRVLPLADNFRSHEGILNFVNAFFASLMRSEIGGVEYDEPQHLRFGAPKERKPLTVADNPAPRVELHLALTGHDDDEGTAGTVADLSSAEREARLVALRLIELKDKQFQIWDKDRKKFRSVEWSDMAILLRSPRNKAEGYAKVFEQSGVPLIVARGGFFESVEVLDLLSLLQTLDNPLQDLPLLATLRSPLAGLTLDELATIRLAHRNGPFWTALVRWHEKGSQKSEARNQSPAEIGGTDSQQMLAKVNLFLERFHRWRQLARQVALSQCIEAALDETGYEAWLSAQSRGGQRHANAQRLLALTRKFDQFQRQGLFRFLKFVEAQLEAESDLEPASATAGDAVQLMSIHQSKGLDFPVVVVADLGKRFNLDDLKERVILDEKFGLCPKVKPPHTARTYPSLPYWLAQRRQRRETLGEELRLLYVATTRARDALILTGTATRRSVETWTGSAPGRLELQEIFTATSYLGWIGRWLPRATGHGDWTTSGQSALLSWTIYEENDERLTVKRDADAKAKAPTAAYKTIAPAHWEVLQQKLDWRYPFASATVEPAKTSVSVLRRRIVEADDEAAWAFEFQRTPLRSKARNAGQTKLSAAEIGTAHHTFLQFVSLECTASEQGLRKEAARIQQSGTLTAEEVAVLDFTALTNFWQSKLGLDLRQQPEASVQREIPFTARMCAADLRPPKPRVTSVGLANDEFVVVQGVVDLAVINPKEMWLLDFKTDDVVSNQISAKTKLYEPQLKLYALALTRIYRRPVTRCWLHFLSCAETVSVALKIERGERDAR